MKNWNQTISSLDSKHFFFNIQNKTFQFMIFTLANDHQVWPWPSTYLNKFIKWTTVPNKIILKSMHKCRSYGPHKHSFWPFYHLTFKCDLDLQPTWTNVSNGISTPRGQQLCQYILKSMHKCTSHGPDKSRCMDLMHTHTHTLSKAATAISRSPQVGSTKMRIGLLRKDLLNRAPFKTNSAVLANTLQD